MSHSARGAVLKVNVRVRAPQIFYELLIPAIVADERVAIRVVKDIRVEIKLYEIYPVALYAVVQKVEDIFARLGLCEVHVILPAVFDIEIPAQSRRFRLLSSTLDLELTARILSPSEANVSYPENSNAYARKSCR